MNLYIKQRIFTWGDKFSVYDENGNEKYYVEGEVFIFGKKLHLYDLAGNELAFIEQRLFTFFKHEYTVNGLGWSVHGDFFDHDYEVEDNGTMIASVSKEWFTLGDVYEIRFGAGVDEINALAVVLVIDAFIDAQRA